MRLLNLLALVGLIGCGDDDGDSKPASMAIVGTSWQYIDGASNCGLRLDLGETDYQVMTFCAVSTTSGAAEIELGTYEAYDEPAEISFTPKRRTCPTTGPASTAGYSVSGSALSLHSDGGVMTLSKVDTTAPGSNNLSVTFGCYDSGEFVAHPMKP